MSFTTLQYHFLYLYPTIYRSPQPLVILTDSGEIRSIEEVDKEEMVPGKFIGKEIDVVTDGDIKAPVSFSVEGREYKIDEILEYWPDHGYGRTPPKRARWYHRRHRNYYRVKTADGDIYEMYYDRGTGLDHPELKKWFLTRRL